MADLDGDLEDLDEDQRSRLMTDLSDAPYRHPLLNEATAHLLPIYLDKEHGRGTATTVVGIQEGGQVTEEGGTEQRFSGLVEFERRKLTQEERAELRKNKGPAPPPRAPKGKVAADLMNKLSRTQDEKEEFDVVISFERELEEPIFSQVEDALARGEIETIRDVQTYRQSLVQLKQQRLRERSLAGLEEIKRRGPSVLVDITHASSARALLKRTDILALAERPDVHGVYANNPITDDSPDGTLVRQVAQVQQFIDAGYDGQRAWELSASSHSVTFAQFEPNGAFEEHPAFSDNSSGATRVRNSYDCGTSTCSLLTTGFNTAQEGGHATAVASTIFADLTQGQDSGAMPAMEPTERSTTSICTSSGTASPSMRAPAPTTKSASITTTWTQATTSWRSMAGTSPPTTLAAATTRCGCTTRGTLRTLIANPRKI